MADVFLYLYELVILWRYFLFFFPKIKILKELDIIILKKKE